MQPLYGAMAPLTLATKAAIIYPWYQAGGAIALTDIAEWVENPTIGQLYAGGTIAGAWAIAFRSVWPGNTAGYNYAFDAQTGRVIIGNALATNGFFVGSWAGDGLLTMADNVYFLISNGASVQAYRNNVAVGSAYSSANDIGGTARWRNNYSNTTSPWTNAMPKGAIYKIALDATQRAALYTSMVS